MIGIALISANCKKCQKIFQNISSVAGSKFAVAFASFFLPLGSLISKSNLRANELQLAEIALLHEVSRPFAGTPCRNGNNRCCTSSSHTRF